MCNVTRDKYKFVACSCTVRHVHMTLVAAHGTGLQALCVVSSHVLSCSGANSNIHVHVYTTCMGLAEAESLNHPSLHATD